MKMYSKGYSLWLQPKGEQYSRFAELIKRLADKQDAPIFQPHITLLGEVGPSEERASTLAQVLTKNQKPFTVTLGQIGYEDFHFRTLFVRANMTPELLTIHERAKDLFGMQNVPPYMPHLSLLYGNYSSRVKEQIISEIGREQKAQFEINNVQLVKGGRVEDWKVVKEFKFS